jgi:general secretion pathway protein C
LLEIIGMLTVNTKQIRVILLLMIGLFGLAAGYSVAQISGWLLASSGIETASVVERVDQAFVNHSVNIDSILAGNIFDPSARGNSVTQPVSAGVSTAAPVVATNLLLQGTIDGGDDPLALIEASGKVLVYRPGDSLPGGGELLTVERSRVLIRQADGREAELLFVESKRPGQPAARTTRRQSRRSDEGGIRDLGGNRWEISQSEIDKARSNLGELLKQARMEPYVVNSQTEGFVVRMIRPRSLLANLGMKVGDVVRSVNGVELDSAEKALQIFQQLREAKRLTVDLTRGAERMTFDYEVN